MFNKIIFSSKKVCAKSETMETVGFLTALGEIPKEYTANSIKQWQSLAGARACHAREVNMRDSHANPAVLAATLSQMYDDEVNELVRNYSADYPYLTSRNLWQSKFTQADSRFDDESIETRYERSRSVIRSLLNPLWLKAIAGLSKPADISEGDWRKMNDSQKIISAKTSILAILSSISAECTNNKRSRNKSGSFRPNQKLDVNWLLFCTHGFPAFEDAWPDLKYVHTVGLAEIANVPGADSQPDSIQQPKKKKLKEAKENIDGSDSDNKNASTTHDALTMVDKAKNDLDFYKREYLRLSGMLLLSNPFDEESIRVIAQLETLKNKYAEFRKNPSL